MSELITAHNRAITALRAGETVDQLSVRINQTKINVIKHLLEGLQDLMWLSVKERIGTPATEATLLQVRENFKVVSCSRKQAIAELIMAIFQS
jgi:hypothetical protein